MKFKHSFNGITQSIHLRISDTVGCFLIDMLQSTSVVSQLLHIWSNEVDKCACWYILLAKQRSKHSDWYQLPYYFFYLAHNHISYSREKAERENGGILSSFSVRGVVWYAF